MGKVSPVSIKYVVYAKFIATGTVEKPDVIGAIFGQTEGLLGADLEMRDLQKEGKIGRIDVNLESSEGKTLGEIEIPSALDKTETTIIAAALETIDRIGPSDAKIQVEKIEDVRTNKREYVIERAKKLLEQISAESPESREIGQAVSDSARVSKIQSYGTEMLPAGDISGSEIIVVEGRADVVNLLKHGVSNVVGMNGTVMPRSIQDLSKNKTVTLFCDGDRGGALIAKNVSENATVSFVTFAPSGMEVEELSGKDILTALRKKMPIDDFKKQFAMDSRSRGTRSRRMGREEEQPSEPSEPASDAGTDTLDAKKEGMFKKMFEDLTDTKSAYLVNSQLEVLKRLPISDVSYFLGRSRSRIYALIMDGTASNNIIEAAEQAGCRYIVARNFASARTNINLLSF